jgi:uncharacterized ferritin-like protein (DUF455 family)
VEHIKKGKNMNIHDMEICITKLVAEVRHRAIGDTWLRYFSQEQIEGMKELHNDGLLEDDPDYWQ